MSNLAPIESEDEQTDRFLAALDIGSNSFHFVYARQATDTLQILHTEKYRVKLADGLDEDDILSDEAIARGVGALTNLLSSTENLTSENIRVVATYTLRQAKNANKFLAEAKKVFPFDIEIISGHEEARLIYQGVAHNTNASKRQLVVDIGGGSTECVIGEQLDVKTLVSLNMGCVSYQKQFFSDDNITKAQFNRAIIAAKFEIEAIVKRFKKKGWQVAVGTSGTIKALYRIINVEQELNKPITLKRLQKLKKQFIQAETVSQLDIAGLKENRREVICSGLAILIALFEMLDIEEMHFCTDSLREGVLYQQLDMLNYQDIRQRAINSLGARFNVDQNHAENVASLANAFFDELSLTVKFPSGNYKKLLNWACEIHELGIDINPSSHHKHGEYIINNADLSGFTQEQQQALSWLVGNQRKKPSSPELLTWYNLNSDYLLLVVTVLRLSVLLNQQRQLNELPPFSMQFSNDELRLQCDKQWLLERPLVDVALFNEQQNLAKSGISLRVLS